MLNKVPIIVYKKTSVGNIYIWNFQREMCEMLFCMCETVDIIYLIQFKISEFQ